jgi:hypothetical protein
MATKTKKPDRHEGVAVFARIPSDLYAKLRDEALFEHRSMGAQVAVIIQTHFAKFVEKEAGK